MDTITIVENCNESRPLKKGGTRFAFTAIHPDGLKHKTWFTRNDLKIGASYFVKIEPFTPQGSDKTMYFVWDDPVPATGAPAPQQQAPTPQQQAAPAAQGAPRPTPQQAPRGLYQPPASTPVMATQNVSPSVARHFSPELLIEAACWVAGRVRTQLPDVETATINTVLIQLEKRGVIEDVAENLSLERRVGTPDELPF